MQTYEMVSAGVRLAMQTCEMVSAGGAVQAFTPASHAAERERCTGVWSTQREGTLGGVAIWAYSYDFAFLGLFVLLVGGTIVCLLVFPWGGLIQGFVHTRQALSL